MDPVVCSAGPWDRLYRELAGVLVEQGLINARLNSAGTHAVCGVIDCGTQIAYVSHPTANDIAEFKERGETPLSCLQFLPGWAPRKDGVWSLSNYARRRLITRRSAKVRRYPQNDGTGALRSVMNSSYEMLPIEAKCAKCGFRNVLREDQLGIPRLALMPVMG